MAVAHESQGNSKQQVEEKIEPSCRGSEDAGSCEPVQPRKASNKGGNRGMSRGLVKCYRPTKKRKKDNQDSLSDIDDSELVGYLNTKEEIDYKRALWEAINRNYTQGKKARKTTQTKKGASVKKAAKTTEKVEIRKPSSRVNYDALKLLENESDQDLETAQTVPRSSYDGASQGLEADEGNYNEDEHDTGYIKDDETFDDPYGDYRYGDGHTDYEYFDF
ncbi:transcription factor IIB [Striga asiatica]|uniref:Transcription factor IIB n=1 Tax=Striga asiatica TaxID=4170 RepID=A0A5A7Q3M7_STRAF|nr:transcription factor IIB [Striga asiatica]